MATFDVIVTQYHHYYVEAEDEYEVDMCCPIADTHYDEIDVEEMDEE